MIKFKILPGSAIFFLIIIDDQIYIKRRSRDMYSSVGRFKLTYSFTKAIFIRLGLQYYWRKIERKYGIINYNFFIWL